jgi:hypothetical protein
MMPSDSAIDDRIGRDRVVRGHLIGRRTDPALDEGETENREDRDAGDRSERGAAQADEDRPDETREPVEGRRSARGAAGHVDDGRPRDLVEDDLRFGEALEMPAAAKDGRVDRGEGERAADRREDDQLAHRVPREVAAQIEEGGRREQERDECEAEPRDPREPVG